MALSLGFIRDKRFGAEIKKKKGTALARKRLKQIKQAEREQDKRRKSVSRGTTKGGPRRPCKNGKKNQTIDREQHQYQKK
jgi:hypothetical protein